MALIQINIPYTTKSKSGVEYTKYKKVYIDEDKANQIAEEERKKKIEELIFK